MVRGYHLVCKVSYRTCRLLSSLSLEDRPMRLGLKQNDSYKRAFGSCTVDAISQWSILGRLLQMMASPPENCESSCTKVYMPVKRASRHLWVCLLRLIST